MDLKGKRILFIAPSFFNYWNAIKRELEIREAKVHWVNSDVETMNRIDKNLYFHVKSLKEYVVRKYFRKFLKDQVNYDIVFVIRGEILSVDSIKKLKSQNPNATFIMYQWDGANSVSYCKNTALLFDRVLTFDIKDSKEFGWEYCPLFYLCEDFKPYQNRKYDLTLIGSLHSRRLELLHKVKAICNEKKLKLFSHLYSPMISYIKRKYILRDVVYLSAHKGEVSSKTIALDEVYKIFSDSKILVDFTATHQTGFSMRTIECLANRCKLITNNKEILKADFYSKENIYVYDIDNFEIPNTFLSSYYHEIDKSILQKYSLCGWVDKVFSDE